MYMLLGIPVHRSDTDPNIFPFTVCTDDTVKSLQLEFFF